MFEEMRIYTLKSFNESTSSEYFNYILVCGEEKKTLETDPS